MLVAFWLCPVTLRSLSNIPSVKGQQYWAPRWFQHGPRPTAQEPSWSQWSSWSTRLYSSQGKTSPLDEQPGCLRGTQSGIRRILPFQKLPLPSSCWDYVELTPVFVSHSLYCLFLPTSDKYWYWVIDLLCLIKCPVSCVYVINICRLDSESNPNMFKERLDFLVTKAMWTQKRNKQFVSPLLLNKSASGERSGAVLTWKSGGG